MKTLMDSETINEIAESLAVMIIQLDAKLFNVKIHFKRNKREYLALMMVLLVLMAGVYVALK